MCSQILISLCADCCWWLYASCRWWHAVVLLDCRRYSHFSSLCVSIDRTACFPLACSHLLLLFFVIFDSSFRLSKSIYIDLAYRHAGRPCRVLYVRTLPLLFPACCSLRFACVFVSADHLNCSHGIQRSLCRLWFELIFRVDKPARPRTAEVRKHTAPNTAAARVGETN